jgi:acetolactate synthase-1/2/3 large subunit
LKNYHDGGDAILEAFRNLNIEYVISSPGSEWPSFWEAMARQKQSGAPGPTYLDCGHETIAGAKRWKDIKASIFPHY